MNPMSSGAPGQLRRFQDAFAYALLEPETAAGRAPDIAALVHQPGFAIYRNTVIKGCIDALQSNYPAVARLVGDEWFRAAASIYARANLPTHPALVQYGEGFEGFLSGFEPAAELPYLPGVARLLDTCAAGGNVAEALGAAVAANPASELATLFAQLLNAGAFGRMTLHRTSIEDRHL